MRLRSDEGTVYRTSFLDFLEPVYDVGGALVAASGSIVGPGWQVRAGFPVLCAGMILVARRLFFPPHLVVTSAEVVVVGMLVTRRFAIADIGHAEADRRGLVLHLVSHEDVEVAGVLAVPRSSTYPAQVARVINERLGP